MIYVPALCVDVPVGLLSMLTTHLSRSYLHGIRHIKMHFLSAFQQETRSKHINSSKTIRFIDLLLLSEYYMLKYPCEVILYTYVLFIICKMKLNCFHLLRFYNNNKCTKSRQAVR